MRGPRFYWGFRFTRRGLRPYAGVRMGSWSPHAQPVHHQAVAIYTCSDCGHVVRPGMRLCPGCGHPFSGRVLPPTVEYVP